MNEQTARDKYLADVEAIGQRFASELLEVLQPALNEIERLASHIEQPAEEAPRYQEIADLLFQANQAAVALDGTNPVDTHVRYVTRTAMRSVHRMDRH